MTDLNCASDAKRTKAEALILCAQMDEEIMASRSASNMHLAWHHWDMARHFATLIAHTVDPLPVTQRPRSKRLQRLAESPAVAV